MDAYQSVSVVTSFAILLFGVSGAVMLGLATPVIDFLTTYKFLPLAVTGLSLAVIFASSSTRDPRYYHPAEYGVVVATMIVLLAYAFLGEFQAMVSDIGLPARAVLLAMQLAAGGVVAR
ncbi:hypothetical protein [Halocalculus aciditolerans]|uniref:Uncharacterized protein n=1 Tax=Halocalculus aciditolerans TaxID=1383812 RepID=A0A830FK49_9EURY|nr:hypothetical protein [Halocalculus aciditolerans]GGL60263.1 hypothetical protein GCM10009039_18160 [Halocalculus aciditolerans]